MAAGRTSIVSIVRVLPIRWVILALFMTISGAAFIYAGWADSRRYAAMKTHGTETSARIADVKVLQDRNGRNSYSIVLAWTDTHGRPMTSRPRGVSDAFWGQITFGGNLIVRETRIVYLEDEPDVLPLVVADRNNFEQNISVGITVGPVFLLVGLFAAWMAWRRMRAAAGRLATVRPHA
jgi:hypothetical protein